MTQRPPSAVVACHGPVARLQLLLLVAVLIVASTEEAFGQPAASEPASSWRRHAVPMGVTRGGAAIVAIRGPSQPRDRDRPRLLFVLSMMDERRLKAVAGPLLDSIVSGEAAIVTAALPAADLSSGYPPKEGYYDHPTQPESRYLWRWIGMEAPDLVVEVVAGDGEHWFVPTADLPALGELASRLPGARPLADGDALVQQLVKEKPAGVGVVPAVRVVTDGARYVATLQAALSGMRLPPSPARIELTSRAARSPRDLSMQLLEVYGTKLDSVQYIPALALIGRLRQNAIDRGPEAPPPPTVLDVTAPYLAAPGRTAETRGGSSIFPGHLVFGELAKLTGEKRYVDLVVAAADAAFQEDGTPREAMPMHNEMSDAVFMGCPILAQAAGLTGLEKYSAACLRNLRFIEGLCLRDDGLYRHSPLDDAAWGRGNGFPAIGLCWSLDTLPESSPVRGEILAAHVAHLTALLPHQDATGCWHQVIDRPESYREFTATAMICYALMRGIRTGRLDAATFGPPADRAWEAVRLRVAADGTLVDVCTGTGKQPSLRAYYDRPAILGRDDRGGAMALLVATERQLHDTRPQEAIDPRDR